MRRAFTVPLLALLSCSDPASGTCACPRFEACSSERCVPADTLLVRLSEGVAPQWLACPIAAGGHGERLLEKIDACTVTERVDPLRTITQADVGVLSVEGTPLGRPILATEQTADNGCFDSSEVINQGSDFFNDGDLITFRSSGGTTFPPIDETLTAPNALGSLTAQTTIRLGDDVPVAWLSDGTNSEVTVSVYAPPVLIRCEELADSGIFTVPAPLSSYLPPGPYNLIVSAVARRRFTPAGSPVSVELQLQSALTIAGTAE